ncbi:MAG: Gldg family protein [Chloroflexi bacterium]|nr:Gldg family protein [Chloroflexota bacterium]
MAAPTVTPPEIPPLDTAHRSEGARRFRYGGNTFVMVALALAVLVAANLVVSKLKVRWDLTAEGTYTLSEQTQKVLGNLQEPITITGFYTAFAAAGRQQAEDLLKEYQTHTDKLQVEFVDPDQQPGRARQLGIQQDGTLVVQSGDQRQDVTAVTESQITGALLKLTSDRETTVYFLTGHGERSTDDFDANGYGDVRAALERDNFTVEPLNLATASDDTWKQGVVVINTGMGVRNVGGRVQVVPVSPLLPEEKDKLLQFLNGGGRAVLLLSPGSDPSYNELLAPFGLKLGEGVVVDQGAALGDVTTPAVQRPGRSTITESLPLTIFPRSAAILDAGERPTGVLVQPLMESSPDSWLETNLQAPPQFDEGQDAKGPLRLAVSVEPPAQNEVRGRLVVIASADAFANGILQAIRGIGNQDFLLNAVNWVAQQEEAIGIRPKELDIPTVVLTQGQYPMVLLSSAALFPGLILLWGLATWWSRR